MQLLKKNPGRVILTLLLCLGLILLTGCALIPGSSGKDKDTEKKTSKEKDASQKEESGKKKNTKKKKKKQDAGRKETGGKQETEQTKEAFDISVYDDLLSDLYETVDDYENSLENGKAEDYYWLADFRYHVDGSGWAALNVAGYSYEDLTGDGTPELIIVTYPVNEYDIGMAINAIYSADSGRPELLVEGWDRSREFMLDSGELYFEGSSGASDYQFGTYHLLSGGEKSWTDYYYIGNDPVTGELSFYRCEDDSCDLSKSEEIVTDQNDYYEISENFESRIRDINAYPLKMFACRKGELEGALIFAEYEAQVYGGDSMHYENYDIRTDNYPNRIVVKPLADVKDFTLYTVEYSGDDGPEGTITANPAMEVGDVSEGEPFLFTASFPGDLPSCGFSYVDADGEKQMFLCSMSGRDGSLCVQKW